MARKYSLLVVLCLIAALCLVFTACGDNETTTAETTTEAAETTTEATETTTTEETTTEATETTTTEVTTTEAPETTESKTPIADAIEERMFGDNSTAQWIQPHMAEDDIARISSRVGTDGVTREYVIYFPFKSESNVFGTTPEDHPTDPNTSGLYFTTPIEIFIRKDTDIDFTRYDITYYETADWWQIWVEADGFVPEDGASYEFVLFVMSGGADEAAIYPDTELYYWDLGDYWTWDAPDPVDSDFLTAAELEALTANRTQLIEHETTTIDAEGNLRFSFKSDGDPFTSSTDTPGCHYTTFGELYINGEKIDIVTGSFVPELWYIFNIQIDGYTFTSGESYEIVFTINPNDPTGSFCKDQDGYFVLVTYVAP